MSLTAGLIGGALLGGAGGIANSIVQKGASDDLQKALGDINNALNQTKLEVGELYDPYMSAGEKGLEGVSNYEDFSFGAPDLYLDPSYQFRLEQGIEGLDRSAAARGSALSGAQQKAVADYSQNLASQEYQNAFNRALQQYNTNLARQQYLANIGQRSTGNMANALLTLTGQGVGAATGLSGKQANQTSFLGDVLGKTASGIIGNVLVGK